MRFSRVVLAASAVFLAAPAPAGERIAVDTAIVFVVDVSGSMDPPEVAAARDAHATAIVSADVLDAVRDGAIGQIAVAYVEFGEVARVRIDWTVIDGREAAARFASLISTAEWEWISGASTMVGAGLLAADELLSRAPTAERLVVDIVGDGTAMDPDVVGVARAAILSRGGVINAMPLMIQPGNRNLPAWYATVAGGPGHFTMPIAGIDKMPMALRSKIVQELY